MPLASKDSDLCDAADRLGVTVLRAGWNLQVCDNGEAALTIDDLRREIAETERLIAVYRKAEAVIVGTEDPIYGRRGLINRTTLPGAEIGDRVIKILERRLQALRAELDRLEAHC